MLINSAAYSYRQGSDSFHLSPLQLQHLADSSHGGKMATEFQASHTRDHFKKQKIGSFFLCLLVKAKELFLKVLHRFSLMSHWPKVYHLNQSLAKEPKLL